MVRVRFAPSPTGKLHLGGLRTALFNLFYARSHPSGKIIFRLEDTDQKRLVPGSGEDMFRILEEKFHFQFDEAPPFCGAKGTPEAKYGPYIQSERTKIYQDHAKSLIEKGHAYRCFCSPHRLASLKNLAHTKGLKHMYDGHCRSLSQKEVQAKLDANQDFVVRLKVQLQDFSNSSLLKASDLVYGPISFELSNIDDCILLKSDGLPTYHLANVVDDYMMEISHVIRGMEWISSLPKHLMLFKAFGWKAPKYAHLPLLLNDQKEKLSKRNLDWSVEELLRIGYEPDAISCYISRLAQKDVNIYERALKSRSELISEFDLASLKTCNLVADLNTLKQSNREYYKDLIVSKGQGRSLISRVKQELSNSNLATDWSDERIKAMIELTGDELYSLHDYSTTFRYLFERPLITDFDNIVKITEFANRLNDVLCSLRSLYESQELKSAADFEKFLSFTTRAYNIKTRSLFNVIRVSISGCNAGPPLFKLMSFLGQKEIVERMKMALTLKLKDKVIVV